MWRFLAAALAACSLQGCDSHVPECARMDSAVQDEASCAAACVAIEVRLNSSFYGWLGASGSGKCRCLNTISENDTQIYKICQDASYGK